MADEEQRLRDIQREYLDFLDDEVITICYFITKYSKNSTEVIFNVICIPINFAGGSRYIQGFSQGYDCRTSETIDRQYQRFA